MIKVIWPEYITLNNWAGNLVADYSTEFIPILQDENKWQEWGAIVASTGIFVQAKLPLPNSFKNWQDWAKVVYNLMSTEDTTMQTNNTVI